MDPVTDTPETPPRLTLWRAIVLAGSIIGPIGWVVLIYAGGSYVDSRSAMLITNLKLDTLPARVDRLEEKSSDRTKTLEAYAQWKTEQDKLVTRLVTLMEQQQKQSDVQQRQLDRQQAIIDSLARRQ